MRLAAALCVALAFAAVTPVLPAQMRASEHGMVAQTVDGTTITIDYYRPVARGRDSLFGKVVHWGDVWTPGANWATTLEVDHPVRLNGNPVPKGKYSIWMVPQREDYWTVMLNRDWHRFHTRHPDDKDEQVRFTVKPEQGPHMETLSFYFPVVMPDGAQLRMHWGTTFVSMRVTVEPSRSAELPKDERGKYPGTYQLHADGPGQWRAFDGMRIEVSESNGLLHARADPGLWGFDPTFDLLPAGDDGEFRPSFYQGGKLFGMEGEVLFAFDVNGRHATGFDMRRADGRPYAHGELVK
jgi:hypothetical protein